MYLLTDKWQKDNIRVNVNYIKPANVMFGVPKYSEALGSVAAKFGIQCTFKHNLVEIKDNTAIFQNDFTHLNHFEP